MSELAQGQPDAGRSMPASIILQKLHDEAPADHFTLDWLMSNLHKQSFGLIMLVLAIVAVAPGVSVVGGLLLLIPAFQMIVGRSAPAFPRWIAARQLPTRRLGTVVQRAITTLGYLEKMIYPRWPTPPGATRRVVGFTVMMPSARLILSADTNPDSLEQHPPCACDRPDLAGLCRGGRAGARNRPPCRAGCYCGRCRVDLGHGPRSKTDQAFNLKCGSSAPFTAPPSLISERPTLRGRPR